MGAGKTIQVDEDVWLQLVHLKYQLRVRSISEVLRQILQNCKNIETQSYKTVEPQGHKSTNPQNYKNMEAAGLQGASRAGAGQAVQVSTGQVVKVPPGQSTTVPSGQVTGESGRGRKPSPLDSVEDLVLVRNVRDPDRLAQAAEERGLLVYSLAGMGLPRTYIVMTQRYRDFVVSVAEGDRTPPSEVEDALTGVLRDKPRELNSGEKYAIALAALRTAGELVYTENGGWRPAKPGSQA